MTGNFYEGGHRQHNAEMVQVLAHNDAYGVITVDGPKGKMKLHQSEVTYAAWFQLLAAKPGDTINILRRVA